MLSNYLKIQQFLFPKVHIFQHPSVIFSLAPVHICETIPKVPSLLITAALGQPW